MWRGEVLVQEFYRSPTLLSAIRGHQFSKNNGEEKPKVPEIVKKDDSLLSAIRSFAFTKKEAEAHEVVPLKPAQRSKGFLEEICNFCFPEKDKAAIPDKDDESAQPLSRSADFLAEICNFQFKASSTRPPMPKALLDDISRALPFQKPKLPLDDIRRAALESMFKAPQGNDASSPGGRCFDA